MANFGFSLRLTFGLLPQTTKIEEKRDELEKEFERLNTIANSETLKEYNELYEYVNSQEFISAKKNIIALKYKNSQIYNKEKQYLSLEKNKAIKNYFNVLQLPEYKQVKDSEGQTEISDEQTKIINKFKKSKQYQLFAQTKNSSELKNYNELKEFVNSEEFKNEKEYLLDKDKYKKSPEYVKESRYQELAKSDDIVWYLKNKNTNKFDELKKWKVTFDEKFDDNKIDEQKWMNSFFWGKMLIDDRYVLAGDKHYYTDNKNIDISGNTLKIITKKEQAKGKVWHPKQGFFKQDFEYTSAMLSTAHSFRQQYGKFEAKIKIDAEAPVFQAFWLKGEKILPEIDVFKFNTHQNKKMLMTSTTGNPDDVDNAKSVITKVSGASLAKGFYIYSVDWTPEKITWKVNDVEVYSTTSGIPDEPLYILLSAGIRRDTNGENIQSVYEIDWVKCYEKN